MELSKPVHGEIRLTKSERVGDAVRQTFTLYLDPRIMLSAARP